MNWEMPGEKDEILYLEQIAPDSVLYDFDGPRIFTLKSKAGLLLAYLCDEDENSSRFVLAPTSDRVVSDLESGNQSVRDALDQPWIWIADVDSTGKPTSITRSQINELPPECLPGRDVMLLPHLQPILSIRMIGKELHQGSIPSSVIKQAIDGVSTALKRIAELSQGTQGSGRPENSIRWFSDLSAQHFGFASFEISFREPSMSQMPISFAGDGSIHERLHDIGLRLKEALDWATLDTEGDKDIDLDLLKALERLVPQQTGVVEEVEIKGRLLAGRLEDSGYKLTRKISKRVRLKLSAERDQQEEIVVISGVIREFDKDKLQFTLRETDDEKDRICSIENDLYDQVMELFSEDSLRVTLSGRELKRAGKMEVSVISGQVLKGEITPNPEV
jgi:hypothetical protein